MIIFTHIAVCSGSSFKEAIKYNFKTYWKNFQFEKYLSSQGLLSELLAKNKKINYTPVDNDWNLFMITEHFPHGIHKVFNTNNYKYVTILRNPIMRCRSAIYKTIQYPKNRIRKLYESCNQDLVKTLDLCAKQDVCTNIMTKQLSGIESFENIETTLQHKLYCSYYRATHSNKDPYTNKEMENFLNAAIKNLHEYDFIGFQEDGNKTFQEFCKKYRLNYKHSEKKYRKTSRELIDINMDNNDIVKALEDMNRYDIRLYNYIKQKYIKETSDE